MEMVARLHAPIGKAHKTETRVRRWNIIGEQASYRTPKKTFSFHFVILTTETSSVN